MPSKEYSHLIIDDICRLDSLKIEEPRKQQLYDFIESTINGDTPETHLTISADLGNNNQGAIVYVLTDVRLIKVDIDTKEIKSSSFPLDTIIGIERKLIDGERAQVRILFQNDSFGLLYSQKDKKITEFFQQVDQSRGKGVKGAFHGG